MSMMNGHDPLLSQLGRGGPHLMGLERENGGQLLGCGGEDGEDEDEDSQDSAARYEEEWSKEQTTLLVCLFVLIVFHFHFHGLTVYIGPKPYFPNPFEEIFFPSSDTFSSI
jgi:hypothetical protein